MTSHNQFNLTSTMKSKGLTLMIHWQGGLSSITIEKDGVKSVQKAQKTVQSIHQINQQTIQNWLTNPSSGYWKPGEWAKRSESARIQDHIEDFVHDMRGKGVIQYYSVSEQG